MLILKSMYAKNEQVSVIITALLVFGIVFVVAGFVSFRERYEVRPSGRGSVYNSESRTFREVQVDSYRPLPGDTDVTVIQKREIRRVYVGGVMFISMGLINLVIGLHALRDRLRAIRLNRSAALPTPDPARSAAPATPRPR